MKTIGLGIALVVVAVVPSNAAAASLWEGKWTIQVQGGAEQKMCLKESHDFVEGQFQSTDRGKFGVISGDLSRRDQNWEGRYKDKGTGDKGTFKADQGESDFFSGTFKPKDQDPPATYDWSGTRTDKDIGYNKCVKSL